MTWHETSDARRWLAVTADLLQPEPGRHTIALTLAERALTGLSGVRLLWWTEQDDTVSGAAVWQAPYPALVCAATDAALVALPKTWQPDTLSGETATAVQAAALLAAGRPVRLVRAERLFRLGELRIPEVRGASRLAVDQDLGLCVDWFRAFVAESGILAPPDLAQDVATRVTEGLLHLWEVDGAVVSLAGHQPPASGGVRVGPVYTPAEHRGRGYGGGVTAAVTQRALDLGAREVVLMTDLTNPTSNALYPRLGYAPLADRAVLAVSPT